MKDYTQPPTDEFAMIAENGTRYDMQWLTLMKSVMNDYWFDRPTISSQEWAETWARPEYVDHFIHKLYYCWQQYLEDNHS